MAPEPPLPSHGHAVDKGVLGQKVSAPTDYSPDILFPVPRSAGRSTLGLAEGAPLPFVGVDVWNCYEASWLGKRGLPRFGTLEIRVPATSHSLTESKSLKLYMNSLNFTTFESDEVAVSTVRKDVARTVGCEVDQVSAKLLQQEPPLISGEQWVCIDECDCDIPAAGGEGAEEEGLEELLQVNGEDEVEEQMWTRLLRSLCPVTGQPDWGALLVSYRGRRIDREGLLRYVCSLRMEVGFHEQVIERIFLAISRRCAPSRLTVTGRFMRRGGIDINPIRSCSDLKTGAPPSEEESTAVMGVEQVRIPGQ